MVSVMGLRAGCSSSCSRCSRSRRSLLIGGDGGSHCLRLHQALDLKIGGCSRNGHGIKVLWIQLGENSLLFQRTEVVAKLL